MAEGGGSSARAHGTAGAKARCNSPQRASGGGPGESAGMADEDLGEGGADNTSSGDETPGAGSTSGAGDDGSSRCFRC